ncbi:conserved hypothetical protein [Bradyrhizobium sp. ORS 375]|uniref:DUF1236 domain-containing protein n=1 Tax=Bradyrhizobium sp. (strain ORS 375) TaxID=566679 RepID=UPI000240ACC4|nr:DUF1236 domain-containing protein [Bradyrhizobium sp. ORS 375]CCD91137.1 conserved hypothetical protein [Bradyrhizobium sp. ORS 375]
MIDNDRNDPDRRRISTMAMAGGGALAVLLVALIAWPFVTRNPIGTPNGGANPSATSDTTVGRTMPAQQAAESAVGKNDPAGQADATGGRERAIKQSSQPLSLSDQARSQVKNVISRQNAPRVQQAQFEMMIGSAVPGQVQLQDIPPEITQIMNGYWGDQYVLVQDKLVIVDQHTRRVVAIVPGVA